MASGKPCGLKSAAGWKTLFHLAVAALILCATTAHADVVRDAEKGRVELIDHLSKTVVCIFDRSRSGGGSGVIITEDGLGLTNFHVVAGMMGDRKGWGGMADGRLYELQVLGIDITGDVAMFRLLGKDKWDFAELGDSDTVHVGDETLALGNPFILADDFTPTITRGIVSGLHRYQAGIDPTRLVYSDCIQIDTSINPGNSGGPLFDLNGRLIGINGRIAVVESRGRVNVGLGFAIPINQIRRFLPCLASGLFCSHGALDATVFDAPDGRVVIDRMFENGPAWDAGLRVGDAIVSIDGEPIDSANRFVSVIGTYPAGASLAVVYERDGERRNATVDLGALPVNMPDQVADEIKEASRPVEGTAILDMLPDPEPLPPIESPLTPFVDELLPRVVRLYGAKIGREPGYGSGVLVSPDGLVVTVMSLLIESPEITAITADGRRWRARVEHRDENRQLVLLKLVAPKRGGAPPTDLPYFDLSGTSVMREGSTVLAAANPFKIAEGNEAVSVSRGVFSGRKTLVARRGTQMFPYRGDVLIIDAITSNPGAAGGALIDLEGRFLGVLGRRVRSSLTNTSLNYATPVEEVAAMIAAAASGEPEAAAPAGKPYHGIKLFDLAYNRKLVYVDSVRSGSPAERAGIQSDDLIMSLNGQPISRIRQFKREINLLHPGDTVTLGIKRGDKLLSIEMTLEAKP